MAGTDLQRMEAALAKRAPRLSKRVTKDRAGVLMALSEDEHGKVHIWLTKRAAHMRSNPGELAFPGGKSEQQDDSIRATAIRESQEEIGLDPADVRVIGQLDPLVNRADVLVTAIVGVIPHSFQPVLNPDEVSQIYCVPLDHFVGDDVPHRYVDWVNDLGEEVRSFFVEYENEDVWGLTLEYVLHLIEITEYGRVPFAWQIRKPTWFERSLL